MTVNVSNATQYFVQAPVADGYRCISATFAGSWTGLPVLGSPTGNGGSYGCRIVAAPGNEFSVSGTVTFRYIRA